MIFSRRFSSLECRLLAIAFLFIGLAIPSQASLTGYLKIPDIPGESLAEEHEDEIDIHDIRWNVSQPEASSGTGRTRVRAEVGDITFSKRTDAPSPYLFLAVAQGKSFPEIVFTAVRQGADAKRGVYLEITMSNCVLTGYNIDSEGSAEGLPAESVIINFEQVSYRYIMQSNDGSAGDEHEVEYDIAAGV